METAADCYHVPTATKSNADRNMSSKDGPIATLQGDHGRDPKLRNDLNVPTPMLVPILLMTVSIAGVVGMGAHDSNDQFIVNRDPWNRAKRIPCSVVKAKLNSAIVSPSCMLCGGDIAAENNG